MFILDLIDFIFLFLNNLWFGNILNPKKSIPCSKLLIWDLSGCNSNFNSYLESCLFVFCIILVVVLIDAELQNHQHIEYNILL